jgi:large subunit ribosomal protein L7Ae
LGNALGIEVGSAAATIIDAGESQQILDQITSTVDNIKNKTE